MTTRQLDENEKKMINRSLKVLEIESEYLEKVEIPKKKFLIDNAEIVKQHQVAEAENEVRILTSKLDEIISTTKELHRQLREGVEVIQNKKLKLEK